jgi:hypothetical protein
MWLSFTSKKMACVNENYSKFQVCVLFRFLQTEGVSESKIRCRLVSVPGHNIFSRKADGRMVKNNDPQKNKGRTRASHNDENCVTVKGYEREGLRKGFEDQIKCSDDGV